MRSLFFLLTKAGHLRTANETSGMQVGTLVILGEQVEFLGEQVSFLSECPTLPTSVDLGLF